MSEASTVHVIFNRGFAHLAIVKTGLRVTQVFAIGGEAEAIIELELTPHLAQAFSGYKNLNDDRAIKAAWFPAGAPADAATIGFAVKMALKQVAVSAEETEEKVITDEVTDLDYPVENGKGQNQPKHKRTKRNIKTEPETPEQPAI